MLITLGGMLISCKFIQSLKASFPMFVTLGGITKDTSFFPAGQQIIVFKSFVYNIPSIAL